MERIHLQYYSDLPTICLAQNDSIAPFQPPHSISTSSLLTTHHHIALKQNEANQINQKTQHFLVSMAYLLPVHSCKDQPLCGHNSKMQYNLVYCARLLLQEGCKRDDFIMNLPTAAAGC